MGPKYPSVPRGARIPKYEDARRDYEKRWEDPAPTKKRDEMHSLRTAMKYAWVMRAGDDGKGEMMPWHSKHHKYVRRPSETPFAAKQKLEKANRRTNESRGRERTSPGRRLRSCLSIHGRSSRQRPRSNDENSGRHPRPCSYI